MRAFRPLWIAFRAALLATFVFWAATYVVDKSGWQAPLMGAGHEAVFFVVFFLGMLLVRRG